MNILSVGVKILGLYLLVKAVNALCVSLISIGYLMSQAMTAQEQSLDFQNVFAVTISFFVHLIAAGFLIFLPQKLLKIISANVQDISLIEIDSLKAMTVCIKMLGLFFLIEGGIAVCSSLGNIALSVLAAHGNEWQHHSVSDIFNFTYLCSLFIGLILIMKTTQIMKLINRY
jgi:hypothetical protein